MTIQIDSEATTDGFQLQDGDLTIRRMQDTMADYQGMATWLTDERVLEFYEGRDNPFPIERIMTKYRPRTTGQHPTTPCLLLWQQQPLGYLQFYPLTALDKQDFDLDPARRVYGIDLFIGEPAYWGQGLGSRALKLIIAYLFAEREADIIAIDPHGRNERAIRAYEKCGFRKVKQLPKHELHEGQYQNSWLMTIDRPVATQST
jgi:aminoglycoside 6'-N-acetyltransferase